MANRGFCKVMSRTSVVYKIGMGIPSEYASKHHKELLEGAVLSRKAPDGSSHSWVVTVAVVSDGTIHFTKNWRSFVDDNQLEEGDIVIFRPADGSNSSFNVDVYDAETGLPKPMQEGMTPKLMMHHSSPAIRSKRVKKETVKLEPGDKIVATSSEHWMLYVRSCYRDYFPQKDSDVILIDEDNKEWRISWHASCRQLAGGWSAFASHHRVKPGDTIELSPTAVENSLGTYKVTVVRVA